MRRNARWSSADGQSLLTYTYNGSNQLATMTAVDGTVTTFNYNGLGKVTSVVTGNGRTTSLAYDGSGNLTQITDPGGGVETFSYDPTPANHRVTAATFGNLQGEWAYGPGNGVATLTQGSALSPSATAEVPADAQGLSAAGRGPVQAHQTDPTSDLTLTQLDGQGRVLAETAPDGGVTTFARDASDYVTAVTDPLGRTTSYALDADGYTTQMTNPDGSTEGFQYQAAFHALISFTDERGATTGYAYDGQGHLTRSTDALGDVTTWTYLANGLLQAVIDPVVLAEILAPPKR